MDHRRSALRNAGALIALSTPITAFISFALVAILIGEDRLEAESGTTAFGYVAMAAPLAIGIAIAAWAHFGGAVPSSRTATVVLATFGMACIAVGIWSIQQSGADANIGGGLLVLFGLITLGASLGVRALSGRPQPTPPPPPTNPAP